MLIAKAPTLTVLVAVPDANGILRFPSADGPYFGIPVQLDHTLSISKQAAKAVAGFLQKPELESQLQPLSVVEPILRSDKAEASLLFLMRAPQGSVEPDQSWKYIIDILKSLPQGKSRVAYNKALQYFAGAAEAEVDILEVDGEVKQRIRELMGESGDSLLS